MVAGVVVTAEEKHTQEMRCELNLSQSVLTKVKILYPVHLGETYGDIPSWTPVGGVQKA